MQRAAAIWGTGGRGRGDDTDCIEQLRGTAGARQVTVRAETALGAFTTPSNGGWIMFAKSPSWTACMGDRRFAGIEAHRPRQLDIARM